MSTEQELDDIYKNSKFILKKRSGFVQSSTYSDRILKKNNVYLFAAGSVFENTFKGEIINVGNKGNHPVYKYAKAMWLEVD